MTDRWEISPEFPEGHLVPLTAEEEAQLLVDRQAGSAAAVAEATNNTNRATLASRATLALTINATFLANPAPNAAVTLAQVQALTKECSALIRLLLGQLDSTTGT